MRQDWDFVSSVRNQAGRCEGLWQVHDTVDKWEPVSSRQLSMSECVCACVLPNRSRIVKIIIIIIIIT